MKKRLLHYTGLSIFFLLIAISFMATVVPLFPFKQWYVRVFDYPRLQTFFVALLALIWYLVFYFEKRKRSRSIIYLILLLAILFVQGYNALPYTPLGKKQVKWSEKDASDTTNISLFICNVLQTNTAYRKVSDKIFAYDPDIVITTESDSNWQKGLSIIEKNYPNKVPIPLSNTYGMHLYSKLPLRQTKIRYLVEPDIPSIKTQVRLRSGEWINLFVLHPRPPVPGEEKDSKERDAEIIMVGREARKEKGGVIVAGDFNDVAWSETTELFQEVSGFLDPRRGRGFYNTFHAKYPVFRWPLDHIFHSSHFKLLQMERVGKVNSDHFPMFVKLSFEPEEESEQPEVKPTVETKQQADETIRKGKADASKPNE